ncbi:RRM domain-containing protein [Durusdinium trenchii]|uniref:RRM domain-containing protein n=1 Tax=Durusdinium trenchii TaxID=1381693 RepID=A0ABP0LDU4_9DINO
MAGSIPIVTSCSGLEISKKGLLGEEVPSINLSLSIGIPVKELIAALGGFHLPPSPPPPPDQIPDCFANKGSASSAKPSSDPSSSAPSFPPSVRGWEAIPAAPVIQPLSGSSRVKVSNILKRLKPDEVQSLFEEHVGPVLQCSIVEDTARIIFDSAESARKAVEEYDGGLLEVCSKKIYEETSNPSSLSLHPKRQSSSWVEERVGPLSKCYLRRGEGWMTVFRAAITKQLKKEDALSQIDFKGSIIEVCYDTSSEFTQSPGHFVVGLPVEL